MPEDSNPTTAPKPEPEVEPTAATEPAAAPVVDEEFDKDRALATIQKQRESEKQLQKETSENRKALAQAQAKLAEFEKAQLSETERFQREAEEAKAEVERLRTEARSSALDAAVVGEATRQGFKNPSLAARLIDRPSVEFEDGKPQGIAEAVAALLKEAPELKRGADAGSPANPGRTDAPPESDRARWERLTGGGSQADPMFSKGEVILGSNAKVTEEPDVGVTVTTSSLI